jgi:hypothetical protein
VQHTNGFLLLPSDLLLLLLWVEGHPGIPPLVTDAFTVVTTRTR